MAIAAEYEAAGADAVSVLTEPEYFLGHDNYLKEIAAAVNLPCLRKDFTVDVYQIYEAKLLGASAVLLIAALLDEVQLGEFIAAAQSLGLSALVETHSESEICTALRAGARIIGVNNRDLQTFKVDLLTSINLRGLVPSDKIFVSESGITDADDIKRLRESGVDAVLIGETLMRAADIKLALTQLRGV
jgi:indole-3-glycerol phosphate synthase